MLVNLVCRGIVFVSAFATLSARAKAMTSDRKPISPEDYRRFFLYKNKDVVSKTLDNSTVIDHSTPRQPEMQK